MNIKDNFNRLATEKKNLQRELKLAIRNHEAAKVKDIQDKLAKNKKAWESLAYIFGI